MRLAWLLVVAHGCSGSSSPAAKAVPEPAHGEAGVHAVKIDPSTGVRTLEPPMTIAGGKRAARPIELTLRSTPPGAKVAIDGVLIGTTPVVWYGESGAPHEFMFVLEGHALARYRFVPVTSGLVHPRLERVADNTANRQPPPEVITAPPPTTVVETPVPVAVPVDAAAPPPSTDGTP